MIKKTLIVGCIVLAGLTSQAINFNSNKLSSGDVRQISTAIYKIENSTKYPFGVRSINTHGDYATAQKICENTIKNNFRRWNQTNKSIDFLTYLGNVYCPTKGKITLSEKKYNKYWIINIHKLVK